MQFKLSPSLRGVSPPAGGERRGNPIEIASSLLHSSFFAMMLLFFALFVTSYVFAEISNEEFAQKFSVTFPIAELGNCTDVASCRTFCEDPVNRTACKTFAQSRGIQNPVETKKEEILNTAKTELGCDSEITCKALCSAPENFQKCSEFAKKNGLKGGYKVEKAAIANQVIQFLNEKGIACTSYESCKEFCSIEENKATCSEMAQKFALRGGNERKGPGGCTSEETCKNYCSDPSNFQECTQYSRKLAGGDPRTQFIGPGGCTTEQSCKLYCMDHPTECRKIKEDIKPDINDDGVIDKNDLESLQKTCQTLSQQAATNETVRKEYIKYCGQLPSFIENHTQLCQLPAAERPDYLQNEENYRKFCEENRLRKPETTPRSEDELHNENNQEKAFGPTRIPTRRPLNPRELQKRRLEEIKRLSPFPTIRRIEPIKRPETNEIKNETENTEEIRLLSPTPIHTESTGTQTTTTNTFFPTPTIKIDNSGSGSTNSGGGSSGSGSGSDDSSGSDSSDDDDVRGAFAERTIFMQFIDWLLVRD